jgi:putative transposase
MIHRGIDPRLPEAGRDRHASEELHRGNGSSDASYFTWRAKLVGMTVCDSRRLLEQGSENRHLKKMLTGAHLDSESL